MGMVQSKNLSNYDRLENSEIVVDGRSSFIDSLKDVMVPLDLWIFNSSVAVSALSVQGNLEWGVSSLGRFSLPVWRCLSIW